ncbi:MAG: LptF/LptG family permease [Chitinophagaceae bacterium]|nr:LptF/LptG family permease [Chitinophagaceae bacterium]
MKKLDRYIIQKFLVTFLFCMALLTAVAVAVDSSEKADDFVKTGMTTTQIIRNYYFGFVPWIWGMLYPLFVFIAVIFFTSRMAMRSEIIAILASGVSYRRFLLPYIISGILLAVVLWFGYRSVIPRANVIRSAFQSKYIDKNDPSKNPAYGGCIDCYYMRLDSQTYMGIRSYDTLSKYGRTFFINKVKKQKIYYNLRAENVLWDTAVKKWKILNATERWVDSAGEKVTHFTEKYLTLPLKPDELRKDYYLKDKLSTPALRLYIEKEQARGTEGLSALKVEYHRRTATSFSVLLLTLIAVVLASRKTRGGSGMHLALGIVIAALFTVSDRFSTVFAVKGNFHPLLAAWMPNLVFSIVAVFLYRKTPK